MVEIWKPIEGFPSYEVSSFGIVKSGPKARRKTTLILKQALKNGIYPEVKLVHGKTKKHFPVHRLVATAFLENPLKKGQVNHKDGDHKNNKVENLEWVTHHENLEHAFSYNLAAKPKVPVLCLNTGEVFKSISEAARGLKVSVQVVLRSINNERRPKNGLNFLRVC